MTVLGPDMGLDLGSALGPGGGLNATAPDAAEVEGTPEWIVQ